MVANRWNPQHFSTPHLPTLYTHTHARPCTSGTAVTPLFTSRRDATQHATVSGGCHSPRSSDTSYPPTPQLSPLTSSGRPSPSGCHPQHFDRATPSPTAVQLHPTATILADADAEAALPRHPPTDQPHRSTPSPRRRARTNVGSRVMGLVGRTMQPTGASVAPPPPPKPPPRPTPRLTFKELPCTVPRTAAGRDGDGCGDGMPPAQPPVTGAVMEAGPGVRREDMAAGRFPWTPIGMTALGSSAGWAGEGRPGPRLQGPHQREQGDRGSVTGTGSNKTVGRAWKKLTAGQGEMQGFERKAGCHRTVPVSWLTSASA